MIKFSRPVIARFNPAIIAVKLYRHRFLLYQLTRRDVLLKYRGSQLGVAWSFLYPLLLLGAFSFVFGRIFPSQWSQPEGKEVPLVLAMYCGLIVFHIFSEVVGTAPRLIQGYQSYVKKIIFPLEILPVVIVITACFHACINLVILIGVLAWFGHLHTTLLLVPIVLLPVIFLSLGAAWLLSAIGVFIKDIAHVMPIMLQVIMFLSPVFYSTDMVPKYIYEIFKINPLSGVIENLRMVTLWGEAPQWTAWSIHMAAGLITVSVGYVFFMHGKEEFADVL